MIYDVKHGYIPHTGKKTLKLEGQCIAESWEETGVSFVVCTVNVNDILKWFNNSDDVDKYLQKNVREFIGDTKINKDIRESYSANPDWFWYKHNGIIIFVDSLHVDEENKELVLRNPQIVNGGQTLKTLFSTYNGHSKNDNSAKVLLRIYRLPYEQTEAYKRSIEIISALNSQNKINPSDLRSTDPRQVRLERLFKDIGKNGYKYHRKRSKEAKAARFAIAMKNLALRYYVVKKYAPQEGVRGNVEELFEEDAKYNEIFNENAINKELAISHPAINYITCWDIDQILQKQKGNLQKKYSEYFIFTRWFVLSDIYKKLIKWRHKKFYLGWPVGVDFVESNRFGKAVFDYSFYAFKIATGIIPKWEEARKFLKTGEATKKFNSRVGGVRSFESKMNKALNKFLEEQMQ